MGRAPAHLSRFTDGGKGAAASAASRAAKSKRSASSDSASSPSSSLSSSPSGGSSLGSLAAACAPLPAGALRRRAVEERQRWRRPRHLVPWRRRPSPASPRAPAQHGSPSIAMRAAAKCLASMSTQLRPVDSTTYRDEERREAGIGAALLQRQAQRVVLRWRLRRRRDARQPWGRVITHILCQQRRTESRTWRHGVRHGERQEQGVCGRKPSSTCRHVRARRGTRGGQEGFRGVNRPEAPWRQNRVLAYPRPTL